MLCAWIISSFGAHWLNCKYIFLHIYILEENVHRWVDQWQKTKTSVFYFVFKILQPVSHGFMLFRIIPHYAEDRNNMVVSHALQKASHLIWHVIAPDIVSLCWCGNTSLIFNSCTYFYNNYLEWLSLCFYNRYLYICFHPIALDTSFV